MKFSETMAMHQRTTVWACVWQAYFFLTVDTQGGPKTVNH